MTRRRKNWLSSTGQCLGLFMVVAAIGSACFVYIRWLQREQRYNKLIMIVADKHSMDPFLIKAVIRRESEFDPFAAGRAGEIGLMQVTEGAGREWARANGIKSFTRDMLWNERTNIEAGTWYLARALRRWAEHDDPLPFALAEYNAGFGNCLRWLPRGEATKAAEFLAAITFPTVRRYIATVTEFAQYYRANGTLE